MIKYQPGKIEPKWQKRWHEDKLYETDLSQAKNKYYCLVELPYTSGVLHIGHWFTFAKGDTLARFKRMQGLNVVLPNGYDTFGLPAENAAIKNNMHPKEWTYHNIKIMRQQFEKMGTMIDWTKTVITCEPDYYKWNQWIFLKLFELGLAYQGKTISNWCPSCQTVLADENVEAGKCWRCGSEVVKREVTQWFFKITDYADKLIWPASPAKRGEPASTTQRGEKDHDKYNWPKSLKVAQNEWIGKSEGVSLKFKIEDSDDEIEVFTTAIDTVFGVTFLVLSPEHPLVQKVTSKLEKQMVDKYIELSGKKIEQERKENKDKSGVFTGSYAVNPLNNKKIPIWIADYVLMSYGTGAVMGVPGHDARDHEFALRLSLPIKAVIKPLGNLEDINLGEDGFWDYPEIKQHSTDAVLFDSGDYNGMSAKDAKDKLSDYIEKNNLGTKQTKYHLHDWSISRQRYWGTPIPIIHCDKCGSVPVPYGDLPVILPDEVDYTPSGDAPLSKAKDWVNVDCPKCGGKAKREVETMDGFVDNSWYFFRYLDPQNETEIFDKKIISEWMPIEIYIGGGEHTYGHALYSRFFSKFFKDLGLVEFDEYTIKRVHHGVVLGPDGHRMSKSRGNVVDPDQQAKEYGADAVRVYLSFMGPYDIVTSWVPEGLNGIYRFLERVWGLFDKVKGVELNLKDQYMLNKTIQKITQDLQKLANNTAIAALMEWLNYLSKKETVSEEEYKTYLLLLAPLAPHITEELWQMLPTSAAGSIHQQPWPQLEEKYLQEEQIKIAVQVNGKLREVLLIDKDMVNESSEIEKRALLSLKVGKLLGNSKPKRVIYVPGKVLNIVTRSTASSC